MAHRLAKGPNYPLFKKFKFFNMARPELYGGSYLKNLCYERPELAYGISQVAILLCMISYKINRNEATDEFTNKPYKQYYFVMRPDDPRVEILKRRPAYYNDERTLPDVNGKPVLDISRA